MSFKVTFGESPTFKATMDAPESLKATFLPTVSNQPQYYDGDYEITPTEEQQTIPIAEKAASQDIVVDAIPDTYVGSAVPRNPTPTSSGRTVTIPEGYYSSDAEKSVDNAVWHGSTTLTKNPSISFDGQNVTASISVNSNLATIKTSGYAESTHVYPVNVTGSRTVQIPSATWDGGASKTVAPSLSVDYDTGVIEATNNADLSVNPLSADGYAEASHAYSVHVGGNVATQLYTKEAESYTPSGTSQIISAGQLLVGDQTILPVAPPYYDMGGDFAWLGKGAELVGQDFYKKVDTLDNTLYNGWSPSTTAKAIVATVTLSDAKFTASDIDQYAYYIFWECGVDIAYTGSPTLKALPVFGRALIVQNLIKRPDSMANIQSTNCNATVNQAAYTASFLRYYGTTTGSITYTWASSNGLYFSATAPTISSTTAVSPTITPKTPVFNAKVSTTYMSTTSANAIDQEGSKWWIKGTKIYRVKRECFFDGIYRYMCGVVNSSAPST